MNKIFTPLAIAITIFLGASASDSSSEPEIGRPAPGLRLDNNSELQTAAKQHKRVLINLWTRNNPASRIANHRYSQMASGRDDILFVSICTDNDDDRLSRYINYADGNEAGIMLYSTSLQGVSGVEAYTSTDDGTSTYLIDEYGILSATSTPSQLLEI